MSAFEASLVYSTERVSGILERDPSLNKQTNKPGALFWSVVLMLVILALGFSVSSGPGPQNRLSQRKERV